ncbi:P-loop containing nucleoside triphosphate hydrolase protein [Xylariales sp. PMI_506]|nr:P-loop containing nucleoside triphosphate hydrolase protein [Xylariales sp. PMI_506]
MACPSGSDRLLGPRVNPDCRSFDFIIQFEDIFSSSSASGNFHRHLHCQHSRPLAQTSSFLYPMQKKAALTGIFASQLAFLVARITIPRLATSVSLAAGVMSCMSFLRSSRPSTVLALYLSAWGLLCVACTRTLWLISSGYAAMTATLSFTIIALILESVHTHTGRDNSTLEGAQIEPSGPEQHIGFCGRTSFIWLWSTFRSGYSGVISLSDVPPIDRKLASQVTWDKLIATWSRYNPKKRDSLLVACFHSYISSFLSVVIPRLCLAVFTFCQPFLINVTLDFINETNPYPAYGKGLIGACAMTYLGLAVSRSVYQYQAFRSMTRLRGGLVSLISESMFRTQVVDRGEITAVALMGTDVKRIVSGLQLLHETWASLLDIGIACWLLGREISLACIAPIILVAGDMKEIKMLGISLPVRAIVHGRRLEEIETSRSFRKLLVAMILLSLTPINLAPVFTFATYIIIPIFWKDETLLATQAFTSVALISLLTSPVIIFIQALPKLIQCVSSFDRIQEFWNYPTTGNENASGRKSDRYIAAVSNVSKSKPQGTAFSLKGQSFAWNNQAAHPAPVLTNITVEIQRGGITAVVGPVGSGKTALLYALLGELVPIVTPQSFQPSAPTSGIETDAHQSLGDFKEAQALAYCAQEPWLENKTVRQVIVGATGSWDPKWYRTVLFACCLDADLLQFGKADQTRIGSKGINLSGGQKQRIALARAVYSRQSIMLLDDTFSGMDTHTADSVSQCLFSCNYGILRENSTTVIFTTHAQNPIRFADSVIALERGNVLELRSLEALLQNPCSYISKLGLSFADDLVGADEGPATNTVESSINRSQSPCRESTIEEISGVADLDDNEPADTDMTRRNGDFSLRIHRLSLYALAMVFWILCTEFSTIWLNWWSQANAAQPNQDIGMYIGIYAMFGVLGTLAACLAAWFAYILIISNSAKKLHLDLLEAVLGFTQDMELIDTELPGVAVNATSTAFACFAQLIILTIYSRYLGVAVPFVAALLYFLQRFYPKTSRQVRLLMFEAKSPLYAHFTESESATGVTTIRAFGWEHLYQARACALSDRFQRPAYLQNCIQTWLGFVLDFIVAVLAVVLVATVVTWKDNLGITPGGVGVALVILIGLGETLSRLSSIGAVTRVKCFVTETDSEDAMNKGRITINETDGTANDVRLRYNVVSQEALLLSGTTVRFSLDPWSSSNSDDALISALKRVELWSTIDNQDGLDALIDSITLSTGQKQLFSFARAWIRKHRCKILVLDEATSNVDVETEAMIQNIIDSDFQDCTLLAVMHRLPHIMSYDRVALFDAGSVVEFDKPGDLIMHGESQFAELYHKSDTKQL